MVYDIVIQGLVFYNMKLKINQRIWRNVILNKSHSTEKTQQYIDLLMR